MGRDYRVEEDSGAMEAKNPASIRMQLQEILPIPAFERSDLSCRVGYATIRQIRSLHQTFAKHIRRWKG